MVPDWNSQQWLAAYRAALRNRDFETVRTLRKSVFEHTVKVVLNGGYRDSDGEAVSVPWDEELIKGTRMYQEELPRLSPKRHATAFGVYHGDCLEAARMLSSGHQDTAVLNMANRQNPGGGVHQGAGAQEEYLFRCSNYFISLYQYVHYAALYGVPPAAGHRYPMDPNYGGCYSPGVTVFRGLEEDGYPLLKTPWKINFIAVAALNHPDLVLDADGEPWIAEALVPAVKNKMRTILRIAAEQEIRVLVMGALGCGAFRNPPGHVASLFKEVFDEPEFKGQFEKVIFAIKEDLNARGDGNVAPFVRVFGEIKL
ncbi:MAG: hypothetical protein AVO33_04690 [delta proteobacterium ML8_F1]|nr:MAG: hypothetical protein AVO33_04690 [delta proteobacterium ML8_F1]